MIRRFEGGIITVPVVSTGFGQMLDLSGRLPKRCDCVMLLVNHGSGLHAGYPKPVGFVKLPHQVYLHDLRQVVAEQCQACGKRVESPSWVTVVPIRTKDYIDIWVNGPVVAGDAVNQSRKGVA